MIQDKKAVESTGHGAHQSTVGVLSFSLSIWIKVKVRLRTKNGN